MYFRGVAQIESDKNENGEASLRPIQGELKIDAKFLKKEMELLEGRLKSTQKRPPLEPRFGRNNWHASNKEVM